MTQIFLAAGDLSDSMRKVINETFIRVDGVLVEKLPAGCFNVFGKKVFGIDKVKEMIKEAAGHLNNSIK